MGKKKKNQSFSLEKKKPGRSPTRFREKTEFKRHGRNFADHVAKPPTRTFAITYNGQAGNRAIWVSMVNGLGLGIRKEKYQAGKRSKRAWDCCIFPRAKTRPTSPTVGGRF